MLESNPSTYAHYLLLRSPAKKEDFVDLTSGATFARRSLGSGENRAMEPAGGTAASVACRRCSCWRSRQPSNVVNFRMVVIVFLVMTMLGWGDCYNVDTVTAIVHSGESGTMFGFSVAQHVDQSTHWVLVGAPRAQTSQPGITRGGAVYRCRTDRVSACQEVPFDDFGNDIKNNKTDYVPQEDKSNQWFGATVQSTMETSQSTIVACAPRYVYFSATLDKREPVGQCFVSKSTKKDVFSPCKNGNWGYHRQGSCQAGFSVSFSQNGKKLLIGAVGSWYWQGQLYNYDTDNNQAYVSTQEGPPDDDDSYMGYSTAVGDFDGDGEDDYVVGIPKGAAHLGKVALFTQNLTNINNITGEQIGAYFGASLAVTDLNKDGKDDIIVGAPFYSDFDGLDYDIGRVYIYYQSVSNEFKAHKRDILEGEHSKSRFGMALTRLGDINWDGYNDLAVGAPYGGKDGNGAVYIYHGSKKGIITQVSQVVLAKDLATGLSTFGSALSGGWDQDKNLYPDLVVGAYGSDKAVFLRTRPVVRLYASLRIEQDELDLEQKSCQMVDGTRVACFKVYSCLEYDGVGVPNELYFDANWELDVLQRNQSVDEQRAFFANSLDYKQNNTYKLTFKNIMCTTSYAYVKNELLDKLTPIAVDFKFKLHEKAPGSRDKRELEPVLDQYIPTSVRTEIAIVKNCGDDKKCIPNLSLISFRITGAHIIGSGSELEIMVIVENRKEDAFNTKLFVELPPSVTFKNKAGVTSLVPIACGTLNNFVICDLGNPLPAGEKSSFTLRVTAQDTNETTDNLVFHMQVNSTNPEILEDTPDNVAKVEIPVTALADITLYGNSLPEQIILNTSHVGRTEEDERQKVEHVYQLRNLGPSAIKETALQILWPSHDRRGNPILELEGKLELSGIGVCTVQLITPENATKYGFDKQGGGSLQVVLPNEQDEFEDDQQGEGTVKIGLACSNRRCTVIQCLVGYVEANGNFLVTVKSRLNVRNFIRRRDDTQGYVIISSASARIKSLPYNLATVDESKFAVARQSIKTTVNTDRLKPPAKKVEIWVIALAISAGLLVLLILILLLWWCGFFKRRKPEDEGYMVAGVKSSNIDNKIYE